MIDDKMGELESRRLAFIEACAYYSRLKGISLNRMVMTTELAELITERYKMKQLFWAIGGFKCYEQLLADGMDETGKLPDFKGESLDKSMVHLYNFRSMVIGEICNKEILCNPPKSKHNGQPTPPISLHTSNRLFQMAVASATASVAITPPMTPTTPDETVAKTAPAPPTPTKPTPIAAPHDILKGFTVFIKPDVHLDETIPICARDQHLLFNIFGEKWTSPVVIDAYTAIKGQTGFMRNWSNGDGHHT